MKSRISKRSKRGMTLVEVLLATSTLTVGMMSAFYLTGVGTCLDTSARNTTQAYEAAQQEIETLRSMPFDTLQAASQAAGTSEAAFLKADGSSDASRPGDAGYPGATRGLAHLSNGTGTVILTDDAPAPNGFGSQCKHVTVIVRWHEGNNPKNATCSIAVGTMIGQGGISSR